MAKDFSDFTSLFLKKLGDVAEKAVDSAVNALDAATQILNETAQRFERGQCVSATPLEQSMSPNVSVSMGENTTKSAQIKAEHEAEKICLDCDQKKRSDKRRLPVRNKSYQEIRDGVLIGYRGCEKVVVIEDGVKTIGGGAFWGNNKLEIVEFPDSLTEIENAAFEGCISLKAIIGGKHLKWIKRGAFRKCRSLEAIEFGSDLLYMDGEVFENCSGLKFVSFAEDSPLEGVGTNVFSGCKSLMDISWPSGIHYVFKSAIDDCPLSECSLKQLLSILEYSPKRGVYVKPAVIRSDSFTNPNVKKRKDCASTTDEQTVKNSSHFSDTLVSKYSEYLNKIFKNATEHESLEKLKKDPINNSNHEGEQAGDKRGEGLREDNTRNSIALIHQKLNGGLYIEGEKLIGLDVGIIDLVIPAKIHHIGDAAANQCRELETIVFEGKIDGIASNAFCALEHLRTICFKEDVKFIGNYVFSKCPKLESVIFEKDVQTIGASAFEGCSGLKRIQFLGDVQTICEHAFKDCCSLEAIWLPDCCETIESSVFENCYELKRVHLPKKLRRISGRTFRRCYKLDEVEWPEVYREDGHDYPVYERGVFSQAILDVCCEKFVLKDGVMKRVIINMIEDDPDGVFHLMRAGNMGYIERVPQFIMNGRLNMAWEETINEVQYGFQIKLLRTCMLLVDIMVHHENEDNRAERLYALNSLRGIQMATMGLTPSFCKLILPLAFSEILYAIGGNGRNRQKQISDLISCSETYIPDNGFDEETIDEGTLRSWFFDKLRQELGIDANAPYLLSPLSWRYTLPIFWSDLSECDKDIICIGCDFYEFIHGVQSMLDYQHHMILSFGDDYSSESPDVWLLRLGHLIGDGTDGEIHLVMFNTTNAFSEVAGQIEESVYRKRINPALNACKHSVLDFVAVLTSVQVDGIRLLLSEFHLEDMLVDYSSGMRMVV